MKRVAIYNYLIVIEKAEKNYSAYCPDLPGYIATGKTIDETIKNMKEAILFHIEGLKKDGISPPKPSKEVKYKVNSKELLTGVEIAA